MLSIHYVSIMMRIFYISWQQHWECDRTMILVQKHMANERYQQNSLDRLDLRWQLGFQWHRRGIERVFKTLDCFTKHFFHSATICCCYMCICCLKLHQADYQVEELFFLSSIWRGSTQFQCIYYMRRILISRPPRVFRRFKRRSCLFHNKTNRLVFCFDALPCF